VTASFGERIAEDFGNEFRGELLYSGRSDFQKIDVYEHAHFGRVLTLDDLVQTTERDEFCYHEMLVHPALAAREHVERVLIIGGGDGGTLRHALMHRPTEAVMCEIDGEVVRVCREFMPTLPGDAFDDPATRLVIDDGAAFVANAEPESYDAILIDSTDPIGAAVVLFSDEFYGACSTALKPDGVFVSQTGSPMYQGSELTDALSRLRAVFSTVETYIGFVPTYPGVLWSFAAATRGEPLSAAPFERIAQRLRDRGIATRFYTPEIHASSFVLPTFVRELVEAPATASVPQR
jgi:spermidine synthase